MLVWIYQILWSIAPFFIKIYLTKRAQASPEYLKHWEERFAKTYSKAVKHCIWIHAVSVGETQAAESVIQLLKHTYPNTPFLITQMTPTGRQVAQKLYAFAQCRYLPYDKKSYVQKFLAEHQPIMALFMETEMWPNFLLSLKQQSIPTFLINARLSEKSLKGYLKVKKLVTPAVQCFNEIFAQSTKDVENFRQLGADNITVTGNIKYDMTIKPEHNSLAQHFQTNLFNSSRPIIVCGSTRLKNDVNEAYLLLDEWKKHSLSALLVIVPRHPEVFQDIFDYATNLGFSTVRRSDNPKINSDTQVIIGDSMGELMSYYLCADIAFVGGSLVDTGCQNIIEPIYCQVPTIFGPSTYNFEKVCQDALEANCATQVANPTAWAIKIQELLNDKVLYENMQNNAIQFIQHHRGASAKTSSRIIKACDFRKML